MVQAIKIIIVTGVCHFAAYFVLAKLSPHKKQLQQYFIASALIITIAVLLNNIIVTFVTVGFICYFYSRGSNASERIALFFGLAFTLSYSDGFHITPGVSLGGISHPKVLALVLLLPLFISEKPDKRISRLNPIDWAVILFFVWSTALSFRSLSMGGILRETLWQFLHFVMPYLVIRRHLSNYGLVFTALSFALMSQALIAASEAILKWHVHTDVESLAGYSNYVVQQYKYRWGFLRAQASFMNPLIFALFANMAFLCSVIFFMKIGMKVPKTYSKFWALVSLGFTLLGTLASVSRAGMAGSVLIVIILMVMMWAIERKVDPKRILLTLFFTGLLGVATLGQDFLYSHFEYRMRLFDVSTVVIGENMLFGVVDPMNHPGMQSLKQGEGIVDLVNTYLAIGLFNGLPGLCLFIYAIFGGLNRLYDCLRLTSGDKLTFGLFAFASLSILAFNITTTSSFGWSYYWIWLLLAIASNIIATVKADNTPKREIIDPL